MTFPRAPSKEKVRLFCIHSVACFSMSTFFARVFFGDDVTRFPCGYIYIYIYISSNACRQHGFMLKGSKCFTHDLS